MFSNDMIDFVLGNVTNRSMDDVIKFVSTMVFGFLIFKNDVYR